MLLDVLWTALGDHSAHDKHLEQCVPDMKPWLTDWLKKHPLVEGLPVIAQHLLQQLTCVIGLENSGDV